MSSVVLSGDTSGSITLTATAVAGSNTITVPASTGTMALNTDLIGVGQTWQAVTRTSGTTYTNTTGRSILVQSNCVVGVGSGATSATVGGVSLGQIGGGYNQSGTQAFANATFLVPPSATYVLTDGGGAFSSRTTNELR